MYYQTTYPSASFSVLSDNLPLNVILCTIRQLTPQRHSLYYQTTYPSTSFSVLSDNLHSTSFSVLSDNLPLNVILCTVRQLTTQLHSLYYQTTYHSTSFSVLSDNLPLNVILCRCGRRDGDIVCSRRLFFSKIMCSFPMSRTLNIYSFKRSACFYSKYLSHASVDR